MNANSKRESSRAWGFRHCKYTVWHNHRRLSSPRSWSRREQRAHRENLSIPLYLVGLPIHKTAGVAKSESNWPVQAKNGRQQKSQAVILGLGSMFNHSRNQNLGWTRDAEKLIVTYKTLRDIVAGEELCRCSLGRKHTSKSNLRVNRHFIWGSSYLCRRRCSLTIIRRGRRRW